MSAERLKGSSVVVTGGCGFIGSHLVRRLLADGVRRVVVLDSLRYGDPGNLGELHSAVELVHFRLGTDAPATLAEVMRGVDYLFHLAAEKHNQSLDSPSEVMRANIEGTHALYQAAVQAGVKKVVFSSSLYACGRFQGPPM